VKATANAEIRAQLERVLDSPSFRTSKRCSDFLRHVVEESCEGHADLLKERSLGVAVFEREPDYDTNQDPVVRNTAGQVRKRLAQYYCEAGRDREVRIDLPPGSYVPEITIPVTAVAAPVIEPARPRTMIYWIVGLAAVCGLVGWWWAGRADPLEQFWAPLVKHQGAVVMVVGQGHAYKLAGNLDAVFDAGPQTSGTIPMKDVIPSFERYVGLMDVRALVRFTSLFTRFGKEVELRGGRTTSLGDLRGKPAVLVGAFNNSWTLNLTGELRFFFEEEANNQFIVRDRLHPENREWQVRGDLPGTQVAMDYAIVSRVFNPTTEQAIVVAAGIRGGGTSAAGEFLTNPAYLTQALKDAPRGWQDKNVQFVLSTRMFGGNPGPATMVAAHYW
jgi:hypothetical protein